MELGLSVLEIWFKIKGLQLLTRSEKILHNSPYFSKSIEENLTKSWVPEKMSYPDPLNQINHQ